jgi:FkbM family methyltransferase
MSDDLADRLRRRWVIDQAGGTRARLARWRTMPWLILQRLGFHVWTTAPLFFGTRMRVLTGELSSSGFLAFGYGELALTALMLKVIRPGMRVVDVGAHFGYEALLASKLVGDTGRVVSFEPQPAVFSVLTKNLRGRDNARPVNAAVGASVGNVQMEAVDILQSMFAGVAKHENTQASVVLTTLDQALLPEERPVDFLKCDVEGHEMDVLRGAIEVLTNDQPLLVLEAEMPAKVRPRVRELTKFLSPFGYRPLMFEYDGELKMGDVQPSHANVAFVPRRFSFLTTAGYSSKHTAPA